MPDGCLGLESATGLERESWSGEGARAVLSDYARAPAAGGVVGMGGVDSHTAVVFGVRPQN